MASVDILRTFASIPLLATVLFLAGWLSWLSSTCFRNRLGAEKKIVRSSWTWALILTGLYWLTLLPFALCSLVYTCGVPQWLPVPLAHCRDFVVTESGELYVDSTIVARVVRFNRAGEFIASYAYPSGPSKKSTHLAISQDGVLYFAAREKLYRCDAQLNPLEDFTPNPSRAWSLTPQGPAPLANAHGIQTSNGPVANGQALFGEKTRRRFDCGDGGSVTKNGNVLRRSNKDGSVMSTYRSPWLLVPFSSLHGSVWFELTALSAVVLSYFARAGIKRDRSNC